MVKIRLTRLGRKNSPFYRIVISNAKEKRESNFIEYVGNFSPLSKEINFEDERVKYWLSVGAQPTDTVRNLLVKKGLLEPKPRKTFSKQPGKKKRDRASK